MIKYSKGIFGLNLLLRVHGSAIYRAIIPAILASCTYSIIHVFWNQDPKSVLLHPYAAGVLIGGITFLLVFRVTQSYGRYCKSRLLVWLIGIWKLRMIERCWMSSDFCFSGRRLPNANFSYLLIADRRGSHRSGL